MSIQRKTSMFKGKHVEGSGSILGNLDAKARKSFANRANNAVAHKVEHEKELAFEKEMSKIRHQKYELKHHPVIIRQQHHSLLYWLFCASYTEIWQHLFPNKNKNKNKN